MTQQIDSLTEHILQNLSEGSKLTSSSTITQQTKIKKAVGQSASVEARERNDPLYQRMIRYRDLYNKYKYMVHQKYGPRVRAKARR